MSEDIYDETLRDLLRAGIINVDDRVLVACGGARDQRALTAAGFANVTITNLDERITGTEFAPFTWSYQDAEKLEYSDDAFDLCIAADGLHHCRSPHRGLLELYRTARRCVLVLEPRDNLLTRTGVRLGFGQDYEAAAVFHNSRAFGGVSNTSVPNYVYRWTEREIEKTINSYAPWGKHRFLYWYKLRVTWLQLRMRRDKSRFFLTMLAFPFLRLFTWLLPGQSNNFAFAVLKPKIPDDLHPWILQQDNRLTINQKWLDRRYGSSKPG